MLIPGNTSLLWALGCLAVLLELSNFGCECLAKWHLTLEVKHNFNLKFVWVVQCWNFVLLCKTVQIHTLLAKFCRTEVISLINQHILFWWCLLTHVRTTLRVFGGRRNPRFPSVYSSHKTLLWYASPSDLLNCDLPGSMPCPLNEHVHWNTGWGLASTIWTNTSAEEFWLSPHLQSEACIMTRGAVQRLLG